MFLLLLIAILLLWAVMPDPVQAAPLLASAQPVAGYLGIFITFAALIALGIFMGNRDRAKIKADLLETRRYRIRECRLSPTKSVYLFQVFSTSAWLYYTVGQSYATKEEAEAALEQYKASL